MGKENLRHSSPEFESYGLKWEFMRRDPDYRRAYKEYFDDDGTIRNKYKISEMLYLFAREFHILWPIPPDISFLALRKNESRKSKRAIDNIYEQLTFWTDGVLGFRKIIKAQEVGLTKEEVDRIPSIIRMLNYLRKSKFSPKIPSYGLNPGGKTGEIVLNIDIEAPLDRILKAVKDEILYTKKFLNREKEQRGSGKTKRRNKPPQKVIKLREYLEAYITAGDTLVEKDRLPFKKVAKKLYPNDFKAADGIDGKDLESIVDRVRERVKAATKYINGGYREIK